MVLGIWYRLSDIELAQTLFRDLLFRKFCHLELSGDVPDATTIGRFRAKLVEHDLWEALLGEVNRQLGAKHIIMTEGRINIIDATPVEAAQSYAGDCADGQPKRDRDAGWPTVPKPHGISWKGSALMIGCNARGIAAIRCHKPTVVNGFIEVFKDWITEFKVDGYQIDTARLVKPSFWKAFVPAMIEHAKAEGIPNFYIFAESQIEDAALLARETHVSEFPAVLDFALWDVAQPVFAGKKAPHIIEDRYRSDVLFKGGEEASLITPVYIGNHDAGRFGGYLVQNTPDMPDAELVARIRLGHALLFFGRGIPIIYYGSEQGFTGDAHDKDAREDMFASAVASYNDNRLAGLKQSTADRNFDQNTPLYRVFADFSKAFLAHLALRQGSQLVRFASSEPGGLFAFSRFDPEDGSEYLVVMNTGLDEKTAQIEVDVASRHWHQVIGNCEPHATTPGSYRVNIEPLDFVVCRSTTD